MKSYSGRLAVAGVTVEVVVYPTGLDEETKDSLPDLVSQTLKHLVGLVEGEREANEQRKTAERAMLAALDAASRVDTMPPLNPWGTDDEQGDEPPC